MILSADSILCWDDVGLSNLMTEPSDKISIPPEGNVLLIELHAVKTSPSSRKASNTQKADNTRNDSFSPIFFRRSTDNHTPKRYQYNCEAYRQPVLPGFF